VDVDAVAAAAFGTVPGARLAGVVDMRTGLFLSLELGDCQPDEADLLAAAVREIFDGQLAPALRCSFARAAGPQQLEEVIVMGEKAVFLFARIGESEDAALAVACGRESNLGILLTKTREVARAL
jgi:predicted regulator of Ras-like GTPase activity (Roadblock/LC7/MglB family)